MRAAALAGDRVDRLDVVEAELVQRLVASATISFSRTPGLSASEIRW
jgi:hypothetical protein